MSAFRVTFVSHTHADNDLCDRYVAALRARGIDIWYDRDNAQNGHLLGTEIQRELQQRSAFVLLMTEHALSSFWVDLEMQSYLGLMAQDRSRLLLPVRIGSCAVPPFLNAFFWIDAQAMPFEQAVDAIATALSNSTAPSVQPTAMPAIPAPSAPIAKPSAQTPTNPITDLLARFLRQLERASSGRLVRLLATVGALIFACAAWLPWAILASNVRDVTSPPLLVDPNSAFIVGYFKIGDITPSPFAIAAFSMLGLLLAPLLWRPADSLLGAIATHIVGLWLIFATVFVIAFGLSPLVSGKPQPGLGAGVAADATTTGNLALGFWVVVVALVAMWIAVIGLLIREWHRHAFWHLPGNDVDRLRSISQLPRAGVLSIGLIIWAFGFLSAAWAAVNCTQTPLFFSSCQGAPSSGALFAGLTQATSGAVIASASDPGMLLFLDPNIARNAIGILLGGGAALIFLGVWLRAVTRTFCIWTTLWLVLAVALVAVAYSGVGAIIAHPTSYGFVAGAWSAASGVWITLLGLILAIVGLATLVVAALRPKAEE